MPNWRMVAVVSICLAAGIVARVCHLVSRGRPQRRCMRLWKEAIVAASGVRIAVRGLENVPPGGALVAVNHQSNMDVPILMHALPDVLFVFKDELLRVPLFGKGIAACGNVSISRDNPREALRSMRAVADFVKAGRLVALFPEGTRSPDGSLRPFKAGSFHVAEKHGLPVIPTRIDGVRDCCPKGSSSILPADVVVTILPPITPAGRGKDLAEAVRDAMLRAAPR